MPSFRIPIIAFLLLTSSASAQDTARSHPPLRPAPTPANRPLAKGPGYFVAATNGADSAPGSQAKPWRTIHHALTQLKAGDTLYLRGGTYRENVAVRLRGTAEAPITIRSYPKELAIIDGGLREFFDTPEECWEPYPQGAPGEYRSRRCYPNLRHVVGSFGDSMIGLQSYYHLRDLRAASEVVFLEPEGDLRPLWCGPGVWYDPATGYIHARLKHTNLPGFDNYRGETDPRKLPLVLAPFRSLPLHVDGAAQVRFQDLVIRGGGHDTVSVEQSSDIEFDNVTVWCGACGLRALGAQRLKLFRSGLYGNVAPWSSRVESSLRSRPGSKRRDITRLNTHALLVPDANREFSVYAYPFNDDWEIAWCDFTDGSDGLYLGGVSMKFHHNFVDNFHDDGIYLSPMYARHLYLKGGATIHLHSNHFRRALTMLAFGGTESTQDVIWFYRNLVEQREPVHANRPTEAGKPGVPTYGHMMSDHGSPPWPSMNIYHNTFIARTPARSSSMVLIGAATKERPRKLFNNIFVHLERLPPLQVPDPEKVQIDGNLYWQPGLEAKKAASYFNAYRKSAAFENSKKVYPAGFESHSLLAEPRFLSPLVGNVNRHDYRLEKNSPAVNAGVALPADWPDPLRELDAGRPDIGALPLGAKEFRAGRGAAPW